MFGTSRIRAANPGVDVAWVVGLLDGFPTTKKPYLKDLYCHQKVVPKVSEGMHQSDGHQY